MSGSTGFQCVPRASAILLLGSLLLACVSPALGISMRAEKGEPPLIITIRIHDYTHVPPETLARAEAVTSEILRGAGVSIVWVDCNVAVPVEQRQPACARPMGPLDFVLNFVDRIQPLSPNLREIAMGVAAVPQDSSQAYLAYLSIHQAAGAAQEYATPLEQVLGLAAAHEIGHLLLGENAHSSSGLMKASWGAGELKLGSLGNLIFTAEQSWRIRSNLLQRDRKGSYLFAEIRTANAR